MLALNEDYEPRATRTRSRPYSGATVGHVCSNPTKDRAKGTQARSYHRVVPRLESSLLSLGVVPRRPVAVREEGESIGRVRSRGVVVVSRSGAGISSPWSARLMVPCRFLTTTITDPELVSSAQSITHAPSVCTSLHLSVHPTISRVGITPSAGFPQIVLSISPN